MAAMISNPKEGIHHDVMFSSESIKFYMKYLNKDPLFLYQRDIPPDFDYSLLGISFLFKHFFSGKKPAVIFEEIGRQFLKHFSKRDCQTSYFSQRDCLTRHSFY